MWEARESKGRGSVIEKHPQHSKPNKEHGELHSPSGPKVAATGAPRLDAIAGSGTGGGVFHWLNSSIGVAKLVSLTSWEEDYIYSIYIYMHKLWCVFEYLWFLHQQNSTMYIYVCVFGSIYEKLRIFQSCVCFSTLFVVTWFYEVGGDRVWDEKQRGLKRNSFECIINCALWMWWRVRQERDIGEGGVLVWDWSVIKLQKKLTK